MAISMGALTTVLGMVPLLADTLFASMAATIIGGLVLATALTLIVMPAMYRVAFKDDEKASDIESQQVLEIQNEQI